MLFRSILKDAEIKYVGEDQSPSFHYSADETFKQLDYIPKKSIGEGISELIQWQQRIS